MKKRQNKKSLKNKDKQLALKQKFLLKKSDDYSGTLIGMMNCGIMPW